MRAALIILFLFTLACGGLVHSGPSSQAEAFAWAEVAPPAAATDVRYRGEKGIDALVQIQFVLPGPEAARSFAASFDCDLQPVTRWNDPFARSRPGDPDWWVHDASDGATACATDDGTHLSRSLRVDPLDDGRVRVQLAASTR